MSLWHRAPRQVYEVHAEDEYLAHDDTPSGQCTVRQIDASVEDSRPGRVLGFALLVAVTLGAIALVLLHRPHAPAGQKPVAERHAPSGAMRRAFPGVPVTAPPEVHTPRYSKRHARAPTLPAARPRSRRKRIAGGHAEPPRPFPVGRVGDQRSALTGGEFDFER